MMRPLVVMGIIAMGAVIISLFQVKYKVRDLRRELIEARQQIAKEEQMIHVLRAEWGYLNQPERLEPLAKKYLNLQTIRSDQVIASVDQLSPSTSVANLKQGGH